MAILPQLPDDLRAAAVSDPVSPQDRLRVLLDDTARGDTSAFEQVYDQNVGVVLGLAIRVLRDRVIALEVAQDAFAEIWRTASRYDSDRGSPQAWIMTITHARAVERLRYERAVAEREQRGASRQVRSANKEHEPLTLAYYDGYTFPEVAAILQARPGTVSSRIRTGIANLSGGRIPATQASDR